MATFNGWQITRTGILFIVGIIVLAGLVFGGIWLVRERGEQARRDEAIKVAEQNLEEQSEQPVATTNEGQSDNEGVPTMPQGGTATELPATGIEAWQIAVLGILALTVGYYINSRRALSRD